MKKGISKIIIGVLVAVAGITLVVFSIIAPIIERFQDNPKFIGPGTFEYSVEAPGKYYLYYWHDTIVDGVVYNQSSMLPEGMKISITDSADTQLPFQTDIAFTFSSTDSEGRSVGYVETSALGTLNIDLSGFEKSRVFSFGPNDFFDFFKSVMLAFALIFLSLGVGAGIVVWGIIDLAKRPKPAPPPVPAP